MTDHASRLMVEQRVAVITGAASGVGRALAFEGARRGMSLVLGDIEEKGLEATRERLTAQGVSVVARRTDVRRPEDLEALAALAAGADIALVFANAGVLRPGALASQPVADRNLMFEVNVLGVLNTIAAFAPRLTAQASPSQFVITGSQAAFLATPLLGAYTASKHALWAIAETLRQETSETVMGVSLLSPGAVRTAILDYQADAADDPRRQSLRAAMDSRGLAPEAVAEIAIDGALARRFWIFPQPAFKTAVRRRFDAMLADQDPVATDPEGHAAP